MGTWALISGMSTSSKTEPHQNRHLHPEVAGGEPTEAAQWPPQSPDINPVEHIWPQVNQSLYDREYNSKDDLWSAMEAVSAAVPNLYMVSLYASMQRRFSGQMGPHQQWASRGMALGSIRW